MTIEECRMKGKAIMKLRNVVVASVLIAVGGCRHTEKATDQSKFFPDTKCAAARRLASAQAAAGARAEGMLYSRHFDGDALNSVGKQKLSLMLGDEGALRPLAVYMVNAGTGEQLEKRQQDVRD